MKVLKGIGSCDNPRLCSSGLQRYVEGGEHVGVSGSPAAIAEAKRVLGKAKAKRAADRVDGS
jgi:hypothetical protein